MTSPLIFQVKDHVGTITLNTPDNLNAMDEAMAEAFRGTLEQIKNDLSIRAVVITGSGRAFSSGGNLDMIEAKTKKEAAVNKQELMDFYRSFLEIKNIDRPFIAAVNGHAIGAGFCLSLACDLRYAASSAKMGANFARIGLAPGMGGTYLITRLLGPTKAAELMLLAQTFTAQDALNMGLINQMFEPDKLLAKVNDIASTIAHNGPLAIRAIKTGIGKAMHASLDEMFDYDSTCQAQNFASNDILEGVKAIREKRQPVFKGN